jgi:GxxExxY protein
MYHAKTPRRQDDGEEIGKVVVDAALKVHRELGPGLLETVYEVVLARELERRGLRVERQVPVAIVYERLRFEEGFRADIIVEGKVILELKSVEQIGKVHAKQVFTYLKLTGLKLGFVLNFGANLMKNGIERVVKGLSEQNLGVLASWRETKIVSEPGGSANAAQPHR